MVMAFDAFRPYCLSMLSRQLKTPPMTDGPVGRSGLLILSIFSDAAVWAGFYVIGAVVCVAQVAGVDPLIPPRIKMAAAAFAFCTATGVYLLDRVKLRNAWLDPADAEAHPRRFAFIAGHATAVRGAMVLLLAAAALLATKVSIWGACIPVLAATGVLIYAGKPRGQKPRPKDIVLLKNIYVSLGITGFAVTVALAAIRPGAGLAVVQRVAVAHALPLAIACAYLALRVVADAALCDLDDEESDRHHGTHTLPIHLGRIRAWNMALGLRVGAALALMMIPTLPLWPRLGWAAVTIISSAWLRLAAPARLRDWVDARFAVEAAAVALILCLARTL
jgi:1,4-dihydroxy-2-naphthoate octaprenyltransferase